MSHFAVLKGKVVSRYALRSAMKGRDETGDIWAKKTPKNFRGKHPDWYWVEVEIPMTRQEMLDFFGSPCSDHSKDCSQCQAWRSWRKTGRAVVTTERTRLLE